jgi:hypothetical protein
MPEEERIDFSKDDELVPVVFGRDEDEAEEYRQLLEDHEIEATVGFDGLEDPDAENGRAMSRGIPVLVPDSLLDEASEIIADREDTEEFDVEDDFDEVEDDEEDEFTIELDEEDLGGEAVDYLDEDDELEEEFFEDDEEEEFDDDEDFEL